MQEIAWGISSILMLCIMAVFVFVALNGAKQEEYEPVQKRFYSFRSILFWAMLGLFVVISVITLPPVPYAAHNSDTTDAQRIDVTGYQWYWQLSDNKVVAGQPVVFHVTSGDVNHGLGIYDENLTLLTQTQAMPGYTNKLLYTFDEPGEYKILCLEYCGLVHHGMESVIQVQTAN